MRHLERDMGSEWTNGEVDWKERCEQTINPTTKYPTKCNGFLMVSWFSTLIPDRWCKKTECITCHNRTFKHISVASKTDAPFYKEGPKAAGMLECPTCHVFVNKVSHHRGALMCDYCINANVEVY